MGERVRDKVAFVTGAARGQGRSHAVRLAEFRDQQTLRAAVADGLEEFGQLDIVVANAGIFSTAPSPTMSESMWRDMIDVNLTGVWNTCQATMQPLIDAGRGGSIVLTSSSAGIKTGPNITHYSAAKHGVIGIMRSLAAELAPHWIRVNSIHPTTVATDMIFNDTIYRLFRPDLDSPGADDVRDVYQALNLLPIPWVEAADISNAVLFLASDEARYVTAVALPVDAGATQR